MKILNFILYISHSFLLLIKKVNNQDLKGRTKNALVLIIFMLCLSLISLIYSVGIFLSLVKYNGIILFSLSILIFFLIRYLIFKRYNQSYNNIIEELKKKFNFRKRTIIVLFLAIWILSISSVRISVLLVREFVYK